MFGRVSANVCFACLFLGLSVGYLTSAATAQESDASQGPIIAAVPRHDPPLYSVTSDGQATGLAVDVFDNIAHRAHLRVDYLVVETWEEVEEALKTGEADVVPNVGITARRAAFASFTQPLQQIDVVMVRRVEDTTLTERSDLTGHVVGAIGHDGAAQWMTPPADLVVHTYQDEEHGLDALLLNEIDALALPEPVFRRLTEDVRIDHRVRAFGAPLAIVQRAIAVRKDNTALLAALNDVVTHYVGSADHVGLKDKWGNDDPDGASPSLVTWMSILAISLVVIAIAIWKARTHQSPDLGFSPEADGHALGRRLRRHGVILTLILVLSIAITAASTLTILYNVAFDKQRERLVEMVRSQARAIEAAATFNATYGTTFPGGATAATLHQIKAGLSHHPGIGEFTLAQRVGDSIVFLVRQRAWDRYQPSPIPLDSDLAEPMRQALLGRSGTLIGKDYRGVTVLAAFEPVPTLHLGIVAKVDIREIRSPFVRAGLTSAVLGVLTIVLGTTGFVTVGDPLVRQLVERERWFAAIVQHAGVGIALVDAATGRIVNANDRYAAILGLSANQVRQASVVETVQSIGTGSITSTFDRLLSGEQMSFTTEIQIRRADGCFIWVKLTVSAAWRPGERPGRYVLVVDDISERRLAEETVNKFFEQPMNLHLIAGLDSTIHRVNAGWERTLGYPPDRLIGTSFMDLVHPDDIEVTRAQLARLAQGEVTQAFENRYRHGSGNYRWLVWSAIAAVEENRVFAVASDITDRKRSEEFLKKSEETFEWFLSATDDVVWLGDGTRLEFISDACERIFGYPKDTFLRDPSTLTKAIHPEDRAAVLAVAEQAQMQGTLHQQYRILHTDGSVHWVDDRKSFERDTSGQIIRMGGVTTDITERIALERDLAEKTRNLEESNNDLQQFAHIASHDLREPLRMVASFLQLLERNYAEALDDTGREFIGFAVNGAKRMDALINDLLSFSRVQTHGRAMTAVDSGNLLREALENLAPRIEETQAVINQGPLPKVLADGPQLIQLFQNLISNALKYRDADRPIEVHIGAEWSGEFATFTVQDNGIGIDPRYHDHIFRIFQRLHGREEFGGGTGVGLSVCKRIVDRHGGRIWVESAVGQGSTFAFTLPLAP